MPELSTEQIIDAAVQRITAQLAAGLPDGAAEQVAAQLSPQFEQSVRDALTPLEGDRDALIERVDALEAELASRPAAGANSASVTVAGHNPHAAGAALDGRFDTAAEFYAAAVRAGRSDLNHTADGRLVMDAVLSGQEIELGGALVPEEFRASMTTTMLETAVIRPGAMVLAMTTETMRYPYVRDYDHSSGRVYGGWQVYRVERGQTIPVTEPTWGQQRLTVTTNAAATVVDNALLADSSMALGMFIEQGLPTAIAWSEDYDFLRGSGAGEPHGILESDAVVTAGTAGRDATADEILVATDVNAMMARMLPACQRRAVFIAHPGMYQPIGAMTLSGAQFARRDQMDTVPLYLNGRPVMFSEHCSAPGTSGDIILVDRAMYVIGDRQAVTIASSMHLKIQELQTIILAHSRNDGQLLQEQPLTLRHGGADWTLSCAVVLGDVA